MSTSEMEILLSLYFLDDSLYVDNYHLPGDSVLPLLDDAFLAHTFLQ
jgi:hypothetical protein